MPEGWGSGVPWGLVGGLGSVALMALAADRARAARTRGALRHGAGVALVAGACLALAAICAAAFLTDRDLRSDPRELVAAVVLVTGFGLGGACLLAEYLLVHGRLDDEALALRTPWTGRKVAQWRDLRSAKWNPWMGWYVLAFRDGTVLRISRLLHGHGAVLEQLRALGHDLP